MNREDLIKDRTLADVNLRNIKGTLSFTDMNRIEEWCEYLATTLRSYTYIVNIETKTNWSRIDWISQKEINRIKNNLEKLKQAYYTLTTTPETDMTKTSINYIDVNDIEQILYDLDSLVKAMPYNNIIRSGVANCGQSRLIQQKFRRTQ